MDCESGMSGGGNERGSEGRLAMWKWIKFSFRVWLAYLTAQIVIALGVAFAVLFLVVIIDLIALLPR